jgi:hypothetical protein
MSRAWEIAGPRVEVCQRRYIAIAEAGLGAELDGVEEGTTTLR